MHAHPCTSMKVEYMYIFLVITWIPEHRSNLFIYFLVTNEIYICIYNFIQVYMYMNGCVYIYVCKLNKFIYIYIYL